MSTQATKADLADLENSIDKKIDKAVDDLSEIIQTFATQVDQRFNQLEERVDKLEKSIDRLTNTIDGFVKRLEDHEVENKARDSEVARLTRWVEQIAQETGVKLR